MLVRLNLSAVATVQGTHLQFYPDKISVHPESSKYIDYWERQLRWRRVVKIQEQRYQDSMQHEELKIWLS
jgi:hypothetical protein